MNACDSCGRALGDDQGAFCDGGASDRHDALTERAGWWR